MRTCAWCRGPIPERARVDSVTCSKRCRQARHRFVTAVGTAPAPTDAPLRLAYADPPYPGLSHRYYAEHEDYAGEVDHAELIAELQTFDGWALSTNASSLQALLALCPPSVRVAAWVRGERPNQSARGPQSSWEPVIFSGGRGRVADAGERDASRRPGADPDATRRASTGDGSIDARRVAGGHGRRVDSLVYHSRPRLTDPDRVVGAKPAVFARWMFELLGATAGDELVDVFPGSGGIGRAWSLYTGAGG